MARKKRSLLPTVTRDDLQVRPELLRRTPRGWAWKCAHCGQFASSETVAGKFVCRSHGGVTARQRDPEARQIAREQGKPLPNPPGRPLKHGWSSRHRPVRVEELVENYKTRRLDADCTDEDMLYPGAYLQERREVQPPLRRAAEVAEALHVKFADAARAPGDLAETERLLKEARLLIQATSRAQVQIENAHARVIRMARVRADTRVKNRAAQQLEAFSLMVNRLAPADFEALQARMARDLAEVPAGVVDGRTHMK